MKHFAVIQSEFLRLSGAIDNRNGLDMRDPRLHPNYIEDHNDCPVCGEHYRMTCRCKLGNKTCPSGHGWHTCQVHNRVFVGDSHKMGALKMVNGRMSDCTCPTR